MIVSSIIGQSHPATINQRANLIERSELALQEKSSFNMANMDDLNLENIEWLESDMFVYVDTRETLTPEELANEYEVTEEFLRDYLTPGWEDHPIYLHGKERRKKQDALSHRELQELEESKKRLKSILKTQAHKARNICSAEKRQSKSINKVRLREDEQNKESVKRRIDKLEKELERARLVYLALDGDIKTIDDKIDYYLEYYKDDIAKLRNLKVSYKEIAAYYGVSINRLSNLCKKHGMTKKYKKRIKK